MTELELIESYFTGELSPHEKAAFEGRLENDPAFAEEVTLYILSRRAAEEVLLEEKRKRFLEQFQDLSRKDKSIPIGRSKSWWYYGLAAAATLLLFVLFITFLNPEDPQRVAESYIEENLATLSTTMSGATDSLAQGIAAFNGKDYALAESIFESLQREPELSAEATEYLGITYLRRGDFHKAEEQFKKLIAFDDLYRNPGKFYLAVTLMRRSENGDVEEAKRILQDVVDKALPGHEEASQWLKDL